MPPALRTRLADLGDTELDALARTLERRTGLARAIGGKDARDFIQEAVRRVLSGERSIDPDGRIDDALVRIGQSLVWSERKRREPLPLADETLPARTTRLDTERMRALHTALAKAHDALRPHRDARAFVDRLLAAIDDDRSIKPGDLARELGWHPRRAYAAWRKVKATLRHHFGGSDA